ncbi:MAG: tetratricopeptide repeat protein [Bacteroidales bacterium]|nr:tetratricopeptide repeat protein [Bacteroidales bacterium]
MKPRYIVTVLMLFFYLCVWGQQQSKPVAVHEQSKNTVVQVDANQQDILRLQNEIEATQKQLEEMEKEIELYRGDVRTKVAELDESQGRWLTLLGIVMALIGIILGVVTPIFLNYKNEKNIKEKLIDAKQEASSAKTQAEIAGRALNSIQHQVESVKKQVGFATEQAEQAKQAVVAIEGLKKQVKEIEEKINKDANTAESAAKDAQFNKLFAQAYSEKDALKAIDLYLQVIKIKPDHGAYNNLGIRYYEVGDKENAIKNFNKAVELNPEDADAYNNRAYILLNIGNVSDAMRDVNIAIEKNGSQHSYYETRGEIYMAMGKYEEALADFNRSLSLFDKDKDSLMQRAKCYRHLAEKEQNKKQKNELISKAEADEKMVDMLNKDNKKQL